MDPLTTMQTLKDGSSSFFITMIFLQKNVQKNNFSFRFSRIETVHLPSFLSNSKKGFFVAKNKYGR